MNTLSNIRGMVYYHMDYMLHIDVNCLINSRIISDELFPTAYQSTFTPA